MKTKRKLWFRKKSYGWGWHPASWQGWLVTILYVVLFVVSGVLFGAVTPSAVNGGGSTVAGFILFFSWMALLTASLLAICYRFGETPEWRWGSKK